MQIHCSIQVILDLMPGAAFVTNAEGCIVLANMHAESMFGYFRYELVGQGLEILLPDRFRRRHGAYSRRYFSDLQRRPMGAGAKVLARRKDGTEFPVEIILSGLRVSEEAWALCMIRDASERKSGD